MSRVNVSDDDPVITQQPSAQLGPPDKGGNPGPTRTKRGPVLEELEKLDKVILSQEISALKRELKRYFSIKKKSVSADMELVT